MNTLTQKFAQGLLVFSTVAYLGWGAWAAFGHEQLFSLLAIQPENASGLYELIGSYGGINILLGAFCALALYRQEFSIPVFLAIGFNMAGYGFGRALALLQGIYPDTWLIVIMVVEFILADVAWFVAWKLHRQQQQPVNHQAQLA